MDDWEHQQQKQQQHHDSTVQPIDVSRLFCPRATEVRLRPVPSSQATGWTRSLVEELLSSTNPSGVVAAQSTVSREATAVIQAKSTFFRVSQLWRCDTHHKLLLTLCEDIIQRRVSTPNELARNWKWGLLISMAELWMYDLLTTYTKIPHALLQSERHEHIIVQLRDNGVTCMHAYYPAQYVSANDDRASRDARAPILILFPSLTANQNFYAFLIQTVIERFGWIVLVMNRRGLCEPLRTPLFHIMGNDNDIHEMLNVVDTHPRLRNRWKVAVGFSMGGNVLTRYIGRSSQEMEEHQRAGKEYPMHFESIVAAATICSPLNLSDIYVQSPMIEDVLMSSLRASYLQPYADSQLFKCSVYTQRVTEQLYACRALVDFAYIHSKLFCHMCNNDDACSDHTQELQESVSISQNFTEFQPEYMNRALWRSYATYDAARYAAHITTPLLAITAGDDPIVRHSSATQQQLLSSRYVVRMHTLAGSHCIYRDDVFTTNTVLSWAEQAVLEFLGDQVRRKTRRT